jgi:hypothetical protein
MAADTRLALPQNERKLTDRQFHRAQQTQDAKPRGIGQCTEYLERLGHKDEI